MNQILRFIKFDQCQKSVLYANPGVGGPWRLRHGGSRVSELIDELYQRWREVEQRGLKETPEYRDVLLREIGTLGGLQEW